MKAKPPVMFSEIGDALRKAELALEEASELLYDFIEGKFPTTDPGLAHAARRLASALARDSAMLACSLEYVVMDSEGERALLEARRAKPQDVLRCDWDRCTQAATHRAYNESCERFCCANHAEYFRGATPLSALEAHAAARALEVKP